MDNAPLTTMILEPIPMKIIYNDPQNIHNTTINNSVISAARALIEEMVATVTFNNGYKFNVFRDDNVKSITYKVASVINRPPEAVTILGNNGKQELQRKMTYRISQDTKLGFESQRFKPENTDMYMSVFAQKDYIFPNHVVRKGELGRRLEEIFLVTNRYLASVLEDKQEETLIFYLDLSGIKDAELIWFERDEILKDLNDVMRNRMGNNVLDTFDEIFHVWNKREEEDVNDFLDEVFDDIFPGKDMKSFIKIIKTSSVRDVKLLELLNAVWKFIYTKQGKTFTEMKKRLKEEILEGINVCTTGVCAHLVSVIQGFFDIEKYPSLMIRMSLLDEVQANLIQNINKIAMERGVDPLMDKPSFKTLINEYIDTNAKKILGVDDLDAKQLITGVAYTFYRINE
jgi:hypothetical protein